MSDKNERTEMLLGREAVEQLKKAHVAVFGLGGVGGHAAEALARAGVGALTLVDGDRVSVSNLNRQLFATVSTVGMDKTEAAAIRIREVAPDCRLTLVNSFVLPENIGDFDFSAYDYVVDAIDTVSTKLALIKACDKVSTPIISAMGAGNKLDPTRFEVADIYETSVCPLAAVIRRECRKAGVRRLKVVYSREEAVKPEFLPESDGETKKTPPASCSFVPSVCGLIIAGEVVKDICANELARSLEARKNG